ncbi:MAG: BrnA antitoxin family protein [Steroidobacteraceae bacterium]
MKEGLFSRLTGIPPTVHPKPAPEAPAPVPVPPAPAVEEIVRDIVREGLPATPRKAAVSLRLDADVLDWFKAQGSGYQTRINAVLRAYMEAAKQA